MTEFAYDVRCACLHEYAHYFVARLLDVDAWLNFWINPCPGEDERHFLGNTNLLLDGVSLEARRAIALAGVIAEVRDEHAEVSAVEIADLLADEFIVMSEKDIEMAGTYDVCDIEKCLALVNRCWGDIVAATDARTAEELAAAAVLFQHVPPPKDQ